MDILFLEKALTNSDWLGFWGNITSGIIGLIGAGLGVLGAYLVMQKQLKVENEQYRKDRIDNTFFNLLALFQNVRDELDSSKLLFTINNNNLIEERHQKDKYYKSLFESKKSDFIKDIEKFQKETQQFDEKSNSLINALEQSDYSSDVYIRGLHNLERVVESENTHIELFEECAKDLNEFVDDKNGGISFKYEVDEEIIKECVEKGFLKNKYYSGNYFRALYRCLKYIMDSDLKMEDKKFYSGVLRGILSSDEMLVVFYNCMYFEKGEKFKELLEREEDGKRIDFFGDKNDLKNLTEGYDLPFFSKEDLLFSETDMQKLEELIKGN